MDKTEFLKILKENGYHADMSDGIPTVHVARKTTGIKKSIQTLIRGCGYNSSYGIRYDRAESEPEEPAETFEETNTDGTNDVPGMVNTPAAETASATSPEEDTPGPSMEFDIFNSGLWDIG